MAGKRRRNKRKKRRARRHTNNNSLHRIKNGKTADDVGRIATKLGLVKEDK